MEYTPAQVVKLKSERALVSNGLRTEFRKLVTQLSSGLSSEKAREYLNHGVGRRLNIIARCLDRIYEIFPPDREALLAHDEVVELEIYLHAFVININGALDNLAWVYVLERNLLDAVGGQHGVGLFRKGTQAQLPEELREYVTSEKIIGWHQTYAKGYRDGLAHRIPLYIPPAAVDPKDAQLHSQLDQEMFQAIIDGDLDLADQKKQQRISLERICLTAVHSYSESSMVWIHAQVIADANTVLAISELIRRHLVAPSQ